MSLQASRVPLVCSSDDWLAQLSKTSCDTALLFGSKFWMRPKDGPDCPPMVEDGHTCNASHSICKNAVMVLDVCSNGTWIWPESPTFCMKWARCISQ